MEEEKYLIDIRSLCREYGTGSSRVKALDNVSLRIKPGEFVSIVGASGSGKSTLLHILGFFDKPDRGEYYFAGNLTNSFSELQLAAVRNKMIGFVFQSFYLLSRTSAMDNVALPMVYNSQRTNRTRRSLECLKLVGLLDRAKHKSNEMSGGQCQRVAVARALVNKPLIILADEPTGNLDSKSRQEVMDLFKKLNDSGLTVVLVTHDPEVAAQTKRIVRMKDGVIISDETKTAQAEEKEKTFSKPRLPEARFGFTFFEFAEQIIVALRSVWRNKLRSALTVLGMFIGVGAIIALMTISEGFMKDLFNNSEGEYASTIVAYISWKKQNADKLTFGDVSAIKENCPLIETVSPNVSGGVLLSLGDKKLEASLASDDGSMAKRLKNGKLPSGNTLTGRPINAEDNDGRAKVAIINNTAAKKFFGTPEAALNNEIRINNMNFTVIGVMSDYKAESMFNSNSYRIIVPLNTAMKRVLGRENLDSIEMTATSPETVEEAHKQVVAALRKQRSYREDKENDFEVQSVSDQIKSFKSTMGKISMVVYGIAAISLLVGGIGIMNIMLVSVTERTREIGLRKALGAKNSDILGQFIIEAVVLCLLGGLIGIGFGLAIAWTASIFIKVTPAIKISTVLFAFLSSCAIGIAFGFWPAWRAAKLDPIIALRYE